MIRLGILIIITFILNSLFAQEKTISIKGSFYRLENIDSLNKSSLDSIKGELQYYGIHKDTISGVIFPITIYKTYDEWTHEQLFNFVLDTDFGLDNLESEGRVININGNLYSDLRFFKRDMMNLYQKEYLDSIVRIDIQLKNDSILLLNNKIFKKDNKLRIFQRFTGY